jgi:PAS domain S-box-containing protein
LSKQNLFNNAIGKYLPKSKFGIFRRFLFSFIAISLLPLIVFFIYTSGVYDDLETTVSKHLTESIDQKTRETTELQSVLIAHTIERFLKKCESDLEAFASLPRNSENYLEFYKEHTGEVWYSVKRNGKCSEVKKRIPLYKELSFVNRAGYEEVKISDGKKITGRGLKYVANPRNTRYKNERYFIETINLREGEIYVSHLNGFHVSRQEQLQGAKSLDKACSGKFYDGVIRFAKPIYENGKLLGIVVLGLDHRHLMEFTQHVLPNKTEVVVKPSYSSGDYAFMFDDEGWIITHPKLWDIRGVDKNGKLVPPYTEKSTKEEIRAGRIPFNLDYAAFVHPNYPFVAEEVRAKSSGSVLTTNVGGIQKIMAYAPIVYSKGVYKKYGIFGGVTIGLQLRHFNEQARSITAEMDKIISSFKDEIVYYVLLIFGFAALISFFVSRNFSKPIQELTDFAQEIASGNLDEHIELERNDEIGTLASALNFMSYELANMKEKLERSLNEAQSATKEAREYASRLEYQLQVFKSIQEISNILGATFDLDKILKLILRRSVETLGFDRAVLYLLSDDGEYLEFREMYGFTEKENRFVRNSRYSLREDDCIETRAFKSGEIFFIDDFFKYTDATELDRKIRKYGKSLSFVYLPLKTKENILGLLGADKLRSQKKITQQEIDALQIFANQAARIIEITRLYRKLLEQRNFVADILRFMPSGLITVNKDGVITSINNSALRILKLKEEDAINKNGEEVFPEHFYLVSEVWKEIKEKGSYSRDEIEVEIKGEKKYLSVYASPIVRGEGEFDEFLILIEDKTERKLIDEEVKEIEKLAFLGRFAAGIAHEIRNPLTGISLFLDDIHDLLASDASLAKMIEMALREVERLEKLVNEILDYASPSSGKYEEFSINEVLETALVLLKNQFKKRNIDLRLELAEDLPKVRIIKDKIIQALLNILVNAIEAVDKNGKIEIKTDCTEEAANLSPYWRASKGGTKSVRISICDNGPGIDKENLKKIFDPFFTTKEHGTGLGLSITFNIITEHNAKIVVSENESGGACFTIYFPSEVSA